MAEPIHYPSSPGFRSVRITGFSAAPTTVSPFTGVEQTHEWSRAEHLANLTLPPMPPGKTAREWIAFFRRMNHGATTFWLYAPTMQVQTHSPGAVVLDGAGQTGRALNIRGMFKNAHSAIEPGVFVEVAGRLHEVVDAVDSDGGGRGVLNLFPGVVRTGLPDGEPVVTRRPKGEFRLTGGQIDHTWRLDKFMDELSFAARSVIRRGDT